MAHTHSDASPLTLNADTPLLPEIIARHARHGGQREALVTETGRLTWDALAQRMNRIANGFAASGLQPQDRVAIAMSNGEAMVETLLGAMAGGFVTAPLNLSVTDEALAAMMQDAAVSAIVATPDQQSRIDAIWPELDGHPLRLLAF